MEGVSDKCVICGHVGSIEGSTIKPIANSSVIFSEHKKECQKLQQQLSVVFLLRKMLRIPQARLEVLLVKYGDPCDWNISTCSPCNRVFVEAAFVHERISKLQNEFEELSFKLRKNVRDSKEPTLQPILSPTPIAVSRKRRKKGRPKAKCVTKSNPSIPSDDKSPSEVIRQEILEGTNSNQAGSILKKSPVQTTTGERSRKVSFKLPFVKVEPIDSITAHGTIGHSNASQEEETIDDDDDEPSVYDEIEAYDIDDDPGDPDFVVSSPSPLNHIENDDDDNSNDKHCDMDKVKKNDNTDTSRVTGHEIMNNFTAPQPIKDELGYKCPLCPRTTLTKCSSHGHILRAHYNQDKPYYCHLCPTRWRTEAKLRQHLEDEHLCTTTPLDDPEEMLSVEPPKIPKSAPKLETSGSRPGRFRCDLCRNVKYRVSFKSLETLEAHKKSVHLGIKNPYSCKQCGKSFKTSLTLRHHAYVHQRREREDKKVSTRKKPICDECNLSFKTMTAYKSHLKTKTHAGDNDYPFQCELCPKGFFQMQSLENHHRQEHFEQLKIDPFKCPHCDMLLSGQRALDHHIRIIHTKDTLYRCEPCDLGFMFINVYKKHMAVVHAKEKPYLCSYCPKRFSNRSHLETHVRVHTGEKPYKCPNCDKEYADKPTFRRHVETHGEQVHECSICENRKFKIWHAYRLHMKTVHNQKVHKKPSHRLFHEPSKSSTSTIDSNSDINSLPHTSPEEDTEVAGTITNHSESTDATFSFQNQTDQLLKLDTEVSNTLAI